MICRAQGKVSPLMPKGNVPMKGEKIELRQGQLQRFRMMGLVEVGRINLREAAGKMGLSYRQAKRIWKRVRAKGAQGLMHGDKRDVGSKTTYYADDSVLIIFRITISLFFGRSNFPPFFQLTMGKVTFESTSHPSPRGI